MDQQVELKGNRFQPASVTVRKGEKVTWIHAEANDRRHTITAKNGVEWGRKEINKKGETFEWTFQNAPGVIEYFCEIHGAMMSGKVTVTD